MRNRPPHGRTFLLNRVGCGAALWSSRTEESDPRRSGVLIPQVDEPSRNLVMPSRIAVVCGHGESITPDNPKYSLFFAMLRDHRCPVEPLQDKLTPLALAEYQAVLIGGARGQLAP